MGFWSIIGWSVLGIFLLSGIRIVRPIHQMLVETLGKYTKKAQQGFHWIIPIIQRTRYVNITEQMVDVDEQIVQTSDKLNTKVDAVVYFQIKDSAASEYKVNNHRTQLTSLARTTLRAVVGKLTLTQCIQERDEINTQVEGILDKETKTYGVEVLRVEVQRIDPPRDVQEAMNNVVKAEQEKIAAEDFATAEETKADGLRRAAIKEAEGQKRSEILKAEGDKQARILIAEGIAKAIENESTAAKEFFKDEAQTLKQLQVTQKSLENNSKVVIQGEGELVNVIGDLGGIAPVGNKSKTKKK